MNLPEVVISNDLQLHKRIMELNYLKEEQEALIKRNFREISYSLQPATVIKNMVAKLTDGHAENTNIVSMGLGFGKDFLINKLFGKKGSLKGYLTSMVVKKATDYVLDKHPDLITKGINKLQHLLQPSKVRSF